MKFSLRTLCLLVVLMSLAVLAWSTWDGLQRDRTQVAELQRAIDEVGVKLRVNQPALHAALIHSLDEYEPLIALREIANNQTALLREKYSHVEIRDADTVSLREVPTVVSAPQFSSDSFRIFVPESRAVWLKFAVHQRTEKYHNRAKFDQIETWATHSPLSINGPFEYQLPSGMHVLTVSYEPLKVDQQPIKVRLNQQVLLRTVYTQSHSFHSRTFLPAREQKDFGPSQALPWLLSSDLVQESDFGREGNEYAFSLWLSDRSSQFLHFPEGSDE